MIGEIIGVITSIIGIISTNAVGGGSSGLAVPSLFICYHYTVPQSVALWNTVVVIISIFRVTYSLLRKEKHPEGERAIIDFNSVIIFLPLLFIGMEVGFMVVTPMGEGIKLVIFTCILTTIAAYTYRKFYKRCKASNERRETLRPAIDVNSFVGSPTAARVSFPDEADEELEAWRRYLYFPWPKLLLCGINCLLLTLAHLFLGSSTFKSIVGIKMCSFEYWTGIGLYCCLLLALMFYAFIYVKFERLQMIREGVPILPSEFQWTGKMIMVVAGIAMMAGISSSSFSIGGGVIVSIILISKGANPEVAVNTTLLCFTCICLSTTVVFSLAGILPLDVYSIIILALALPVSFVAFKFIKPIASRHSSVIVLGLAIVLTIACVCAPLFGFYNAISVHRLENIWGFGHFCEPQSLLPNFF